MNKAQFLEKYGTKGASLAINIAVGGLPDDEKSEESAEGAGRRPAVNAGVVILGRIERV